MLIWVLLIIICVYYRHIESGTFFGMVVSIYLGLKSIIRPVIFMIVCVLCKAISIQTNLKDNKSNFHTHSDWICQCCYGNINETAIHTELVENLFDYSHPIDISLHFKAINPKWLARIFNFSVCCFGNLITSFHFNS